MVNREREENRELLVLSVPQVILELREILVFRDPSGSLAQEDQQVREARLDHREYRGSPDPWGSPVSWG